MIGPCETQVLSDEIAIRSEASKVDMKLVEKAEALILTSLQQNRDDFMDQCCYQWLILHADKITAEHWLKYRQLEHAWKSLFK